jgi:hypothetical protein
MSLHYFFVQILLLKVKNVFPIDPIFTTDPSSLLHSCFKVCSVTCSDPQNIKIVNVLYVDDPAQFLHSVQQDVSMLDSRLKQNQRLINICSNIHMYVQTPRTCRKHCRMKIRPSVSTLPTVQREIARIALDQIAHLILPVFAVGSVGLHNASHFVNLAVESACGDEPR